MAYTLFCDSVGAVVGAVVGFCVGTVVLCVVPCVVVGSVLIDIGLQLSVLPAGSVLTAVAPEEGSDACETDGEPAQPPNSSRLKSTAARRFFLEIRTIETIPLSIPLFPSRSLPRYG